MLHHTHKMHVRTLGRFDRFRPFLPDSKGKARPACAIKAQLYSFLASALDGGEWSTSRLCHFTPGKNADTH
jgi:hypothetical protein